MRSKHDSAVPPRRSFVRPAPREVGEDPRPVRLRRAMTPRALVLGVVLLLSLLALLYPVREWFAVRGDISGLQSENSSLASGIKQLEARKSELSDPLTLQREARSQLYYVPEGSKLYVTIEPDAQERERAAEEERARRTGDGAWYQRLGESLRWADEQ